MSQPVISHNLFSALSKSKKSKTNPKQKVKKVKEVEAKHAELEKAIFSAPAVPMTNWADDSDEDLELPVTSGLGSDGWNEVRWTLGALLGPADRRWLGSGGAGTSDGRSPLSLKTVPISLQAPRGAQAARYSPFPEEPAEAESESEYEEFEQVSNFTCVFVGAGVGQQQHAMEPSACRAHDQVANENTNPVQVDHGDIEAELGLEVAHSDSEEEEEEEGQPMPAEGGEEQATASPAVSAAPVAPRPPQQILSKKVDGVVCGENGRDMTNAEEAAGL